MAQGEVSLRGTIIEGAVGAGLDTPYEPDIIKEKSKHRESNDRRDGREGGRGAQTLCTGEARHSYQN